MPAISRIDITRSTVTESYFPNDYRIAIRRKSGGKVGEIGQNEHYVCDWHDGISISEF